MAAIGLLGGSFDPVHVGHLMLARAARDGLDLAQLRFVPAGQPWQKGALVASAEHRLRMLQLAIAGEPRFFIDRIELDRPGPSYTIDTLRALRAQLPDTPLVLVIGADQMQRFDTWREWREIPRYAHIAVARRNDAVLTLTWPLAEFYNAHWAPQLPAALAGSVLDLPMPPSDASATEIRTLLAQPPSGARDARLAQLLPPAVLHYIRAHHLYS
ncbi:MAG: nicotinate (nicotinamide) nucleotide adenylyltransferase [Sutterellaceae bacterium]|nr:nicotinate (nicotinamide) nucleotide adenylyltransferase [Burkholderiaceae bacterium]MCX7902552.1 nicotinate (nicotinamide) nucleotide adenylyltransferase [Burkholderiaceae bacterium]MDW8428922.1 nicotinate (nicotinamide) nucleotide adenylyltransferase [Sutterellaceae bacterium]